MIFVWMTMELERGWVDEWVSVLCIVFEWFLVSHVTKWSHKRLISWNWVMGTYRNELNRNPTCLNMHMSHTIALENTNDGSFFSTDEK